MAQRAGDVSTDLTDMDRTRAAMAHKLGLLEERVQETIEDARASVADVVDRAQNAAEDIINRVEDFLDRTRLAIDPRHQMQQHPWVMVAGAIAMGYLLGQLESRGGAWSESKPPSRPAGVEPTDYGAGSTIRVSPNIWDSVSSRTQDELEALKGAAVVAANSFIHDLFHKIIPAIATPLLREAARRGRAVESDLSGHSEGC